MSESPAADPADPDQIVVAIAKGRTQVTVPTPGGPVVISRIQDTDHQITGYWARTSRPCPKSCIQPMYPAAGTVPIGELELLDLLTDDRTVVLDSRTDEWFREGSIPGAISLPFTETADRLDTLGCRRNGDGWDCSDAAPVAMFCNGPWCGQSPAAIRAMVAAGYPADRIHYYREGLQGWILLGLTTTGSVARKAAEKG